MTLYVRTIDVLLTKYHWCVPMVSMLLWSKAGLIALFPCKRNNYVRVIY